MAAEKRMMEETGARVLPEGDGEETNVARRAQALEGRGNAAFVSCLHLDTGGRAAISSCCPASRCSFKASNTQ